MTTATDNYESIQIDLDKLIDCPLNTRPVDPADPAIRELGASLLHRQEVDLIVRPMDDGTFEVLDGKRRAAGARAAGLTKLWCQVRAHCTDADALKVIIVTQLHRKDLDPMAEAALVRQLLSSGMTQELAAHELGRPVAWVAKRAKLCDLVPAWTQGLAAGKYGWATVAYLEQIARLPEAVQTEMAGDYEQAWKAPHSVADFAESIRDRYLHTLKHAPWKIDDLAVLPKAPACTACPKRSSCQATLWDDQADANDRCLDAVCWSEKLSAHTASKARILAEKHDKVVVVTGSGGGEQPAPGNLPAQAVVIKYANGLEECRKTDDGAIPVLDAETGKQNWRKLASWAPSETRKALGIEPEKPAKGKAAAGKPVQPTAADKRVAKRLAMRLAIVDEEITDADPPSTKRILAIYNAIVLEHCDPFLAETWAAINADEKKPLDDLAKPVWEALVKALYCLRSPVRATNLPDIESIEEFEELATLDPKEQAAKVLAEIPEPKGKG